MARVELDVENSLPPQRVREALLDFSQRRPNIWPGLERGLYEVYSVLAKALLRVWRARERPGARHRGTRPRCIRDYLAARFGLRRRRLVVPWFSPCRR
jgi:hypothetical protein